MAVLSVTALVEVTCPVCGGVANRLRPVPLLPDGRVDMSYEAKPFLTDTCNDCLKAADRVCAAANKTQREQKKWAKGTVAPKLKR